MYVEGADSSYILYVCLHTPTRIALLHRSFQHEVQYTERKKRTMGETQSEQEELVVVSQVSCQEKPRLAGVQQTKRYDGTCLPG
jgi:hypothetical protein